MISVVRRPSLHLNWLTRLFKSYPVPALLIDTDGHYGGYYHWPCNPGESVTGTDIYAPHGAIVLCRRSEADTIAHEYRHHLQFHSRGQWWHTNLDLINDASYWQQSLELDALKFELVFAPNPDIDYFAHQAKLTRSCLPTRTDLINHVETRSYILS